MSTHRELRIPLDNGYTLKVNVTLHSFSGSKIDRTLNQMEAGPELHEVLRELVDELQAYHLLINLPSLPVAQHLLARLDQSPFA